MKESILVAVVAVVFLGIGVIGGRTVFTNNSKCERAHLDIYDGRFVIIPVDTIDGRKVYNVVFADERGMDRMYAEEIANSMITGKWDYNQDLVIKEDEGE